MVRARATSGIRQRWIWRLRGQVQGVGFRPFVYRIASEQGLSGTVRNDQSGVTIDAHGPAEALEAFGVRVRSEAPPLARIDAMDVHRLGPASEDNGRFRIVNSDHDPAERGRVTVDSATCADCLRELFDERNRRHRHALINCTNCGPRFTIIRDLPYDRPATTMARFAMCPRCAAEYADPADRRFHAQPTCCPECGPVLSILDARGRVMPGDPIREAARLVREGRILAIKGLGGYHLAVDARSESAVAELRRRKRRDHKPLALMVAGIERARELVRLSPRAAQALASPESPIVLAPARPGAGVASSVAPGCHRLGVMLAYTPVQHLLFAELEGGARPDGAEEERDWKPAPRGEGAEEGEPPSVSVHSTSLPAGAGGEGGPVLVMTSANMSDDPLIKDDEEVGRRLPGMCDAILLHDRPIERAVDDSILLDTGEPGCDGDVGSVTASDVPGSWSGGPVMIRRARGYVPSPLLLPVAAGEPGLCAGAELKNTVAVVREDAALLSQHVGDLSYTLAYERFRTTIADMCRLFGAEPRWVACDAHPVYLSRRYAHRLAERSGLRLIEVQHHHAHLASLLAEHGRADRIVGLVCDGVGWGDDATAWGGEVMVGDLAGYERLGRLRPLRLPGADAAARQTGRCALGWMWDLLGDHARAHPLAARTIPDTQLRSAVFLQLERELNCPPSSGMGRLFDAAAALLGICGFNHHEAMSGQRLESAAALATDRPSGRGLVPLAEVEGLVELDHRPLLERLIAGLGSAEEPGALAWLFHDALAWGLCEAGVHAAERAGLGAIGLSGGVFCNELLTRLTARRLAARGLDVLVHRAVPPNDGGISYGQAAVAACVMSGRPGTARRSAPTQQAGVSHGAGGSETATT